jgi:hypothetical protein
MRNCPCSLFPPLCVAICRSGKPCKRRNGYGPHKLYCKTHGIIAVHKIAQEKPESNAGLGWDTTKENFQDPRFIERETGDGK